MSARRVTTLLLASLGLVTLWLGSPIAAQEENAPPAGILDANLQPPSTFFRAELTDPEGGPLTYTWDARISCGLFFRGGEAGIAENMAEWEHGGETDCVHEGDVTDHEGIVIVEVSDGVTTVTCSYEGSGGVYGDDRFGQCGDGPVEVSHSRQVSLGFRHVRVGLILRGNVDAPGFPDCHSNVPVNIQIRAGGRWITRKTATTTGAGTFSVELDDRTGLYRVIAPRVERMDDESLLLDVCLRAAREARHRH